MARKNRRRWGDNDRHLGPFTFAYDRRYRPLGVYLNSGEGGDSDSPGCSLRLSGFGATLFCELPPILKPDRRWVKTGHYDWAKTPDEGYWEVNPVEYSISLNEGSHLSIDYGPQTGDSSTSKHWGCFLPWTQWRLVAHRVYDPNGVLQGDVCALRPGDLTKTWARRQAIIDATPKADFLIRDFDGEEIKVTTYVEEHQWRLGEGWFKWLGFLRTKKIRRSLDISYGKESGPEKGSYKGGLCGHSIDMLPGENAEKAFRRYCDQEHRARGARYYRITYVGHAPVVEPEGIAN